MTILGTAEPTRILLIDDEEAAFKNLAEALGHPIPVQDVQTLTVEVLSRGPMALHVVEIKEACFGRPATLTWLRIPVPVDNLIDFLIQFGGNYQLIAYDLAWDDKDQITTEEVKAMKNRASVAWRLRRDQAGRGAFVLYQLQNTHDPGREVLSRVVIYSYNVESQGLFIPAPSLSPETQQPVATAVISSNPLGDELLGHIDLLGLIGKCTNPEEIGAAFTTALALASRVSSSLVRPAATYEFIGQRLQEWWARHHLDNVARTSSTVLLSGETGTGKELIARALHKLSPRANGPYVRVNCGALTESLLESELFGHIKGAFTGAIDNKTGRFELANGGTIFLDEINSITSLLQTKLLRVLQEREFERVGESKTISVDVRVIAAANASLEDLISLGRFRSDLYYRLNVIPVVLPPLRERREDIPELIDYFLRNYCVLHRKAVKLTEEALKVMVSEHHWPGNVRELENLVERCVVVSSNGAQITAAEVRAYLSNSPQLGPVAEIKMPSPDGIDAKTARDTIIQIAKLHGLDVAKKWGTDYLASNQNELSKEVLRNWSQIINNITVVEDFIARFQSTKPGSGRKPTKKLAED